MGIRKSFLGLGMLTLLVAAPAISAITPTWTSVAQDDDKDDDSSGTWEGVAMAGLAVSSGESPVT